MEAAHANDIDLEGEILQVGEGTSAMLRLSWHAGR